MTSLQCKFLLLKHWFPFIFHFLCETERCKFHFMEKKKLPSNRSFWFHPQSFTFYRILMSVSMHILYIHASVNPNVYFCYCLLHFFFCCCSVFGSRDRAMKNSLNIYHILGQQIFITGATSSRMSQHVILNDDLIKQWSVQINQSINHNHKLLLCCVVNYGNQWLLEHHKLSVS